MPDVALRTGKNGKSQLDVTPTEITLWLVLGLPNARCCNCGRTGVPLADAIVPLLHERLAQELRAGVRAPHCADCLPTAGRLPPRRARLLVLFPLFFFAGTALSFGIAIALGFARASADAVMPWVILGGVAFALATIVFLGRTKKPVGVQRTAYAAIRIVDVDVTLLGKVKHVTLGFANEAFAREAAGALAKFRGAGAVAAG